MEALKPRTEPTHEPEPAVQEETPDADAIREQIREEVRREVQNTPIPTRPEPASRPTRNWMGGVVAAAVLMAAAAAGGGFALTSRYEPDPNPYAKAVFAPADRDAVAMEVGFTPLPTPEPVVVEEPPETRRRARRHVRKSPRPARRETETARPKSPWGKPDANDANKSLSKFEEMMENAPDPFTIDE
jgi:hypothetical protein